MASPAQLVVALSLVTGVPLPTLVDIDRKLVKAALRTKAGRGPHAARMVPLDAARLLTALLANRQASTAADAVERYAQTRVDRGRSSEGIYLETALDELSLLPLEHSFVDAIAAVIDSAAKGALAKLVAEVGHGVLPQIEVFAFTRATRGRIRLSGLPGGRTANVEYAVTTPEPRPGRRRGTAPSSPSPVDESVGDLEQSRRVTEATIIAIANLLAENSNA